MLLFGLINKRDRADLLLSDLFSGGESTVLSGKHLLGVFITGVDTISLVGVETSFAGVAFKELMQFLTGVASEAVAHLFGELVEEGLSKGLFCVQNAAFCKNRLWNDGGMWESTTDCGSSTVVFSLIIFGVGKSLLELLNGCGNSSSGISLSCQE